MTAKCKSCGAPIMWATSARTGKAMPIDAEPTPNGNVCLVAGQARPYTPDDAKLHRDRYTSHFATCPDAPTWRAA